MILLNKAKPEKIRLGTILVYDAEGKPMPIIHRVVAVHNTSLGNGSYRIYYETKGDHNPYQINNGGLNEFEVEPEVIRGKAFARIPYFGYVKILFADLVQKFSSLAK